MPRSFQLNPLLQVIITQPAVATNPDNFFKVTLIREFIDYTILTAHLLDGAKVLALLGCYKSKLALNYGLKSDDLKFVLARSTKFHFSLTQKPF